MTNHFIVPFDGSSAAARAHGVATGLAARLGGEVELLAVAPGAEQERELREGARQRCLHDPLAVVRADDAAAVIAGAATTPDALVCMATHGRGRSAAVLGSVATDVLGHATGPVLLVGPDGERDWLHDPARVLTGWAGPESAAILPHAADWAARLGGELWLELVFHPLDVPAAEHPGTLFAPALEILGHTAVHLRSCGAEYPAGALVDSARELPASLLALTTHARTGAARTVVGSVTMDVVRHAPCPVLVVGPG